MIQLYQHQEEGKKALLNHRKYCLFFEVGTGKTFTALSALCELKPCKVLIVAPKRVLEHVWKRVTEYDLSKYDVTYMNYEKIARDRNFIKNKYDVVILDEVHKIKGRTSNTSKRLRIINEKATMVWGLTGTPVANNYVDVYNIFNNMGIYEFDMNYNEFIARYYYIKSYEVKPHVSIPILLGVRRDAVKELMYRISKHSMVKMAKDCVDLPDKTVDVVYVDGMVTDKYNEIKNGIFITDTYEKTMIPLEKINKLHQAANGFVYDDFKNVIKIGENYKLKELNDILEDLLEETERIIIVYQYKEDLEVLKTLTYKYTIDPDEFMNNQILFLQYGQSEGLNLQNHCYTMLFYSYDYSFLNFEQICGRIYRNGQNHKVRYIIMVSKGTIEEKIWRAVRDKKSRDEFLKEVLND